MKTHALKLLAAGVLSLVSGLAQADDFTLPPNTSPLFSSDEPLAIRIEAPFGELFQHQTEGFVEARKQFVAGTVTVGTKSIPVEIRMRGYSTLAFCKFPKLMLKFKKEDVKGTIFEKNRKVDLNTHCQDPANSAPAVPGAGRDTPFGKANPHREALVYRWLRILDIPAYSSRPVLATYHDTDPARPDQSFDAAFFEHLSALLKRAGAREIRPADDTLHPHEAAPSDDKGPLYIFKGFSDPQVDKEHFAKVQLFERFIGNYDFVRDSLWNLKLLQLPNGKWEYVPLDFNLSGIVVGSDWAPPVFNDAELTSLDKETQLRIVDSFIAKKDALYASLTALDRDPEAREFFRKTLDSRFEALGKMREELR